jgi:hypothetical protein
MRISETMKPAGLIPTAFAITNRVYKKYYYSGPGVNLPTLSSGTFDFSGQRLLKLNIEAYKIKRIQNIL